MNNNIYEILKKFNGAAQEPQKPATQQPKARTKLEESIQQVSEKYMGFKKVEKAAAAGGAKDPAAVAASIGRKKYGKEKFQKAAAAGKKMGEAAQPTMPSKKAEPVKKKPMTPFGPKSQGVAEVAPPGAKAERMVKHIKKSYAKDGKLTPKEKGIAYATAWKAHSKGKVEETIKAMFAAGYSREQIVEGWEEMMKDVEKRSKEEKGTGKFDKKKTDKGTQYTRKYDAKSGESEDTGKDGEGKEVKKKRGRPKKVNESYTTATKMIAEAFRDIFEGAYDQDYMALQKAKPVEPSRVQGSANPLKRAAQNIGAKAIGGIGKAVRKGLDTLGHADDEELINDLRAKTFREEEDLDESLNRMRRIAGLPVSEAKSKKAKKDYDKDGKIESEKDEVIGSRRRAAGLDEGKKADKDYDGDGKVESGKDEYLGSKIAAAKKAGKLKEGEMCSKCDCDPCECDDKEKVDECMSPIAGMAQDAQDSAGKMNITTNMSSDGNKNVTITADGDAASELMQMLKLAGMGGGEQASTEPQGEPAGVMVVAQDDEGAEEQEEYEDGEEEVDEEKDTRYQASTTPDEKVLPTQVQTKGGDGDVAGREKRMHKHGYKFSDNPMAMHENATLKLMKEYESIKAKK